MFIETSSPRRPGQKAQLQSESFAPTGQGTRCFKFWYHMYGSHMGTVNVYIIQNSTSTLMWTLSGYQGNTWHSAQFPVRTTQSYRVSYKEKRMFLKYVCFAVSVIYETFLTRGKILGLMIFEAIFCA